MKYKSKKTAIIIAMITLSLAGLMGIQLLLLGMAWELKNQAFERNVITALSISTQKLEVGEIADNALKVIYQIELSDSLQHEAHRFEFHSKEISQPPDQFLAVELDSISDFRQLTVFMADNRSQLIQKVVGDLVVQDPRPINERLNRADIDSLLRANLDAVGITLVPDFFIFAAGSDSVLLTNTNINDATANHDIRKSKYKSQLFPMDISANDFEIVLNFPEQRNFLLKQIWPLLAASLVFIAVIITAFIMMLSAAHQQSRFASRIVDFINNMTHEFKTPISTIALASEAISRDDIIEHPEALHRYNGMIGDENHRMRQQVERILQIAQLETGDFQLNLAAVDMHHMMRNSADKLTLQMEKRKGTLTLNLSATRTAVSGDPVHLANVLANLLDNAIKYSPDNPNITLSTSNKNNQIIIEVSDQGIGIDPKDRKRVFEKYYRCPTGNRHDVKGFGLGLSYVRLLVAAHGGEVKLKPVQSKGTCVTVMLPLE